MSSQFLLSFVINLQKSVGCALKMVNTNKNRNQTMFFANIKEFRKL